MAGAFGDGAQEREAMKWWHLLVAWVEAAGTRRRIVQSTLLFGGIGAVLAMVSVGDMLAIEFAGSAEAFTIAIGGLPTGRVRAALWLDMAWIVSYVLLLGGSCHAVGKVTGWYRAARWFVGAAIVAGLLDMIENVALLVLLDGPRTDWIAALAALAAFVKFSLIFGGAVPFVVIGLIRRWTNRPAAVGR